MLDFAKKKFDLIITGRESIDYNGGMVGGLLSEILDYNYVTNCIDHKINNNIAYTSREIGGGKEECEAQLPIIIGSQKGIVEEKDLIIPNMRGIMQARQKPLLVDQLERNSSLKLLVLKNLKRRIK